MKSKRIKVTRECKESVFGILAGWLWYTVFCLLGSDLFVANN